MKKSMVITLHVLYWLLFFSLLATMFAFLAMNPAFADFADRTGNGFLFWMRLMIGFAVIPALLSFYVSYVRLSPALLAKRRFAQFIAASMLLAMLSSIAGALVESLPFLFGPGFLFGDQFSSAFTILGIMSLGAWIHAATGAIISGFVRWLEERTTRETLERRTLQTELELLRAQINPHFLFNTLNNIDILIELQPERASEFLRKLSDMLRFSLYETQAPSVSVTRELEFLEKYLDLQRLRSPNPAYIRYSISGNPNGIQVAPMIFLPFIENAFKHSGSKKSTGDIDIRFTFTPDKVLFQCTNTLPADESNYAEEPGGIGQELSRKRLSLLYRNKHELNTGILDNRYVVELSIDA